MSDQRRDTRETPDAGKNPETNRSVPSFIAHDFDIHPRKQQHDSSDDYNADDVPSGNFPLGQFAFRGLQPPGPRPLNLISPRPEFGSFATGPRSRRDLSSSPGSGALTFPNPPPKAPSPASKGDGRLKIGDTYRLAARYKNPNSRVDIILVPSLGAGLDGTKAWTHRNGTFWPDDLLPRSMRECGVQADVFIFSYEITSRDAKPLSTVTKKLLAGVARRHEASEDRVGRLRRPILWVAHGFGGIILQAMLRLSAKYVKEEPSEKNDLVASVYLSTYSIVFFGTPFLRDGKEREWRRMVHSMLSSASGNVESRDHKLVDGLASLVVVVNRTWAKFLKIMDKFKIATVAEGMTTEIYFQGPNTFKGEFVVDPKVAKLDFPGVRSRSIQETHERLIKFSSEKATGYMIIEQALERTSAMGFHEIRERWKAEAPERALPPREPTQLPRPTSPIEVTRPVSPSPPGSTTSSRRSSRGTMDWSRSSPPPRSRSSKPLATDSKPTASLRPTQETTTQQPTPSQIDVEAARGAEITIQRSKPYNIYSDQDDRKISRTLHKSLVKPAETSSRLIPTSAQAKGFSSAATSPRSIEGATSTSLAEAHLRKIHVQSPPSSLRSLGAPSSFDKHTASNAMGLTSQKSTQESAQVDPDDVSELPIKSLDHGESGSVSLQDWFPNFPKSSELDREKLVGNLKGQSKEGSDGAPSMASSFNDLDDSFVNQSALDKDLLNSVKGEVSQLDEYKLATRRRYAPKATNVLKSPVDARVADSGYHSTGIHPQLQTPPSQARPGEHVDMEWIDPSLVNVDALQKGKERFSVDDDIGTFAQKLAKAHFDALTVPLPHQGAMSGAATTSAKERDLDQDADPGDPGKALLREPGNAVNKSRSRKRAEASDIPTRPIIKSVDIDSDHDDIDALDAEDIDSSARRLRKRVGDRFSLRLQDPLPKRLDELESEGESDENQSGDRNEPFPFMTVSQASAAPEPKRRTSLSKMKNASRDEDETARMKAALALRLGKDTQLETNVFERRFKPDVNARLVDSKIAAAGFTSDLNKKLDLGPRTPKKQEPAEEDAAPEHKEVQSGDIRKMEMERTAEAPKQSFNPPSASFFNTGEPHPSVAPLHFDPVQQGIYSEAIVVNIEYSFSGVPEHFFGWESEPESRLGQKETPKSGMATDASDDNNSPMPSFLDHPHGVSYELPAVGPSQLGAMGAEAAPRGRERYKDVDQHQDLGSQGVDWAFEANSSPDRSRSIERVADEVYEVFEKISERTKQSIGADSSKSKAMEPASPDSVTRELEARSQKNMLQEEPATERAVEEARAGKQALPADVSAKSHRVGTAFNIKWQKMHQERLRMRPQEEQSFQGQSSAACVRQEISSPPNSPPDSPPRSPPRNSLISPSDSDSEQYSDHRPRNVVNMKKRSTPPAGMVIAPSYQVASTVGLITSAEEHRKEPNIEHREKYSVDGMSATSSSVLTQAKVDANTVTASQPGAMGPATMSRERSRTLPASRHPGVRPQGKGQIQRRPANRGRTNVKERSETRLRQMEQMRPLPLKAIKDEYRRTALPVTGSNEYASFRRLKRRIAFSRRMRRIAAAAKMKDDLEGWETDSASSETHTTEANEAAASRVRTPELKEHDEAMSSESLAANHHGDEYGTSSEAIGHQGPQQEPVRGSLRPVPRLNETPDTVAGGSGPEALYAELPSKEVDDTQTQVGATETLPATIPLAQKGPPATSLMPEGWEFDYDGTGWVYSHKPTGIIQYHFPRPGDEFPEFFNSFPPSPDLDPVSDLATTHGQIPEMAYVETPETKNDIGPPLALVKRRDGAIGESIETFRYLYSERHEDINELGEEDGIGTHIATKDQPPATSALPRSNVNMPESTSHKEPHISLQEHGPPPRKAGLAYLKRGRKPFSFAGHQTDTNKSGDAAAPVAKAPGFLEALKRVSLRRHSINTDAVSRDGDATGYPEIPGERERVPLSPLTRQHRPGSPQLSQTKHQETYVQGGAQESPPAATPRNSLTIASDEEGRAPREDHDPWASGYTMSAMQRGPIEPRKAEDWEPYREIITEMYRYKTLKHVVEEMEREHNFRATARQYKSKIKAWGLDNKYTKTGEYLEALQGYERRTSPSPDGAAASSGKEISESSLNRFKQRAEKMTFLADASAQTNVADSQGYDNLDFYSDSSSYNPQQQNLLPYEAVYETPLSKDHKDLILDSLFGTPRRDAAQRLRAPRLSDPPSPARQEPEPRETGTSISQANEPAPEMPEDLLVDLEFVDTYSGGACWTCTPAEPVNTDIIPLAHRHHLHGDAKLPLVIPVDTNYPLRAALDPPPDPCRHFIDPTVHLPDSTIEEIFKVWEDVLGFYLLCNGWLQLIAPDDFEMDYALSHRPREYGKLKVSYILASATPTAGIVGAATGVAPSQTQPTAAQPRSPTIVTTAPPAGSASSATVDALGLSIGGTVQARVKAAKTKNRFEARAGVMTRSGDKSYVTVPTHLLTAALLDAKTPFRLGGLPLDKVEVVARSGGNELGPVAETFDPAAREFPNGFVHDITLIDVSKTPAAAMSKMLSPLPTGWLSQADWQGLKYNTSNLFLLGPTTPEDLRQPRAKSIKLMESQCQAVGQGIFRLRQPQQRSFLSFRSSSSATNSAEADTWTQLVSRSLLFRVHPDARPPGVQSGTAVCTLEGEATPNGRRKVAKVAGFTSFVQEVTAVQSFDMEGPRLYSRLEQGRVAFFGAFQVPRKLREEHQICCLP